jgi:hypothetical protein
VEAGRPPGSEIIEQLRLTIERAEEARRQAAEVVALSKQIRGADPRVTAL